MSQSWISPIRIIEETLIGCSLQINDLEREARGNIEVGVAVNSENTAEDDKQFCKLALNVIARDNDDKAEGSSYQVSCDMVIFISADASCFADEESQNEIEDYMEATAVSLLFGKARAFVEELTSRSIIGTVSLPAISPYDLIESAKQAKED